MIDGAEARAEYREAFTERGEKAAIRRYIGSTPDRFYNDYDVTAVPLSDSEAKELAGAVSQGDRFVLILAEELEEQSFPLPITVNDKLVLEGREQAIFKPDRFTRRIQGIVVAYVLVVRG